MRLLAIDIGNTNITAGLFEGSEPAAEFRLQTNPDRTVDEYAAAFNVQLQLHNAGSLGQIDAVALASVVPKVTQSIVTALRGVVTSEPFLVRAGQTDAGLRIEYAPPESLGADRLVNAFAAHALHGNMGQSACIVVDYGTATKLEAVSADGVYRGGVILPGAGLSMDALFSRAALLRQIDLTIPPAGPIGANTADALRSGILYGYGAQTDGLVARFREALGAPQARVIATGGWASLIAPYAETVEIIDPRLTLTGLRLLFEKIRG